MNNSNSGVLMEEDVARSLCMRELRKIVNEGLPEDAQIFIFQAMHLHDHTENGICSLATRKTGFLSKEAVAVLVRDLLTDADQELLEMIWDKNQLWNVSEEKPVIMSKASKLVH